LIANRLPPSAATALLLLAVALLAIDRADDRGFCSAEPPALLAALLAMLGLMASFYAVDPAHHLAIYAAMSLPTAAALFLLALGIVAAKPEAGAMAMINGDTLGSLTARRLLPATILVPAAIGYLRLLGQRWRVFDNELGSAISSTATIGFFAAMIWSTARLLHRADRHRKNVEAAFRQEADRYRAVVEQVAEGIYMVDFDTRAVVEANASLEKLLGYEPGQIRGREIYALIDDSKPEIDSRMMRVLEAESSTMSERRYKRKDGSTVDVEASATVISYGERNRIATVVRDITEKKAAEAKLRETYTLLEQTAASEREAHSQLQSAYDALKTAQTRMVQSEKLAGLGQMVAGVAHEINNPLAFVANNVAVLQRDIAAMERLLKMYGEVDAAPEANRPQLLAEIREFSEQIDLTYTLDNLQDLLKRSREGLSRIQQIVRDLRDFARLDEGDVHEADLNAGIDSTVNIIRGRGKRKQVQVESDLGTLPPVLCNPAKINQVVMNLLSNAIDASPSNSNVVVRTRAAADNGHVKIEVIDHGSGIEPAIRARIFDPFFTTKPVGEGTGLGLSISYGIIQDHGGTIEVDSTVGKGTTFTVTLPIKPAAAANADSPDAAVSANSA
jgi:PAS domain S-box-containing protein